MTIRNVISAIMPNAGPTGNSVPHLSGMAGIDTNKAKQSRPLGIAEQQAMLDRNEMAMRMIEAAITSSQGSQNPALAFLAPIAGSFIGKKVLKKTSEAKDQFSNSAMDAILSTMVPQSTGSSIGLPALGSSQGTIGEPTGANADAIREGLMRRGLPEHIADAFVINAKDESGLRTDINEIAPLVPGSRGGYGLMQWTGPRRKQLEAFAAQRGVPASDLDAQLDFLVAELQGPEAGAAKYILSAQDTPQAAAAIVQKFLRPAKQHEVARTQRYLSGAQLAQADGGAQTVDPQQLRQLMQIMESPLATAGQKTMAQQALERLSTPRDPLAAIKQETAMLELQQLQNPVQDPLKGAPDGFMWAEPGNPAAGVVPIPGMADKPGFRPATPEEAAAYGATAGQIGPDNRFYPINPPSNGVTQTITNPDGTSTTIQVGGRPGAGSQKPFTEGQSRDNVYATRARGALEKLESPQDPSNPQSGDVAGQLGNLKDNVANRIPLVGNYMTGDGFQVARTAADEFLQAILRKDTGAAITLQEQQLYGDTYLPQPGDSPARLAYKKEARRRALEAIEAGMSQAQIEAVTLAEKQTLDALREGNQPPLQAPPATAPQTYQNLPDGLTEDDLRYLESD